MKSDFGDILDKNTGILSIISGKSVYTAVILHKFWSSNFVDILVYFYKAKTKSIFSLQKPKPSPIFFYLLVLLGLQFWRIQNSSKIKNELWKKNVFSFSKKKNYL